MFGLGDGQRQVVSSRSAASAVVLFVLLLLTAGTSRAERTDVLVLRNGDQLTGEIKTLGGGILSFKTDDMSTLEVKWTAVARLVSIHTFEVELVDGRQYWGWLEDSGVDGKLALQGQRERHVFDWNEVVTIGPVNTGFWARVDGSTSLGFSYTKGSGVAQGNFGLDALYSARRSQWSLAAASIVTSQEQQSTSRRVDAALSYHEDVGGRWFWTAGGGLQQNDELGLDLRSSVTGGVGRRLIQTNTSQFSVTGGLAVNREQPIVGEVQDSAEGVLRVDWRIFRHVSPKSYLTLSMNLLPSLTQSGRVRSDSDLRYRHELIKDLFFELKFYGSTDSEPLDPLAGNSDFGVVTSIGYSF